MTDLIADTILERTVDAPSKGMPMPPVDYNPVKAGLSVIYPVWNRAD